MKTRNSESKEEQTKTITQYVSVKFYKEQILNNYMDGLSGIYDSVNFNKSYTYSSLGFCDGNQANALFDKLDFHKFQDVLNFLNKKWGWKVLSITPIIISEKRGYNDVWGETFTKSFLYTFYREIEE